MHAAYTNSSRPGPKRSMNVYSESNDALGQFLMLIHGKSLWPSVAPFFSVLKINKA